MRKFSKQELTGIAPVAIERYLYLLGWIYDSTFPNKKVRKYVHPKEPDLQIWVPVRQSFSDYYLRISDIIGLLSEWYEKDASEVLKELSTTYSDHLEFRIISRSAEAGKLPLYDFSHYITGISALLFNAVHTVTKADFSPRERIEARKKAENLFHNFKLEKNWFSSSGAGQMNGEVFSIIAGVKVADNESDCTEALSFPPRNLAPFPEHQAVKQFENILNSVCNIADGKRKFPKDESDVSKTGLTENMCKSFLELWTGEDNIKLEIIIRYASAVCADGRKIFVFEKHHFELLQEMRKLLLGTSRTLNLELDDSSGSDFFDDSSDRELPERKETIEVTTAA